MARPPAAARTGARTRRIAASARVRALLFALLVACDDVAGCDERDDAERRPRAPRAGERLPESTGETRDIDAAALEPEADPAPPSGDLAREIDAFTTLDACVDARGSFDPLLADAVRALGYATFVRDACRTLEALKRKDVTPCRAIDVSTLRERCETLVAMVRREPELCPFERAPETHFGRKPACLAAALGDPLYCRGESALQRPWCEALATADAAACRRLGLEGDRRTCARDAERLRPILPARNAKAPDAPPLGVVIDAKREGASPGDEEGERRDDGALAITFRGGEDLTAGVVFEAQRSGGFRFELGRDALSAPNPRDALGPSPRPARLFVRGVAPSAGGSIGLERLELDLPGLGNVACSVGPCAIRVESAPASPTRGAPFALTLQGAVGAGDRVHRVRVEVKTFVRDVVARPSR